METQSVPITQIDTIDTSTCYSIRWSAVFAGLAVGFGVHMLLVLLGVTAGLALLGTSLRTSAEGMSTSALAWGMLSMMVAAAVGGYVAARSCGLRRLPDGMLHAAASWGTTMIFYVLFSGLVAGTAALPITFSLGSMVSSATEANVGDLVSSLQRGDRDAATRALRERFGLSAEQADRATDRALALVQGGNGAGARQALDEDLKTAAKGTSAAGAWLFGSILLSLAISLVGGWMGVRGNSKRSLPGERRTRYAVGMRTAG